MPFVIIQRCFSCFRELIVTGINIKFLVFNVISFLLIKVFPLSAASALDGGLVDKLMNREWDFVQLNEGMITVE